MSKPEAIFTRGADVDKPSRNSRANTCDSTVTYRGVDKVEPNAKVMRRSRTRSLFEMCVSQESRLSNCLRSTSVSNSLRSTDVQHPQKPVGIALSDDHERPSGLGAPGRNPTRGRSKKLTALETLLLGLRESAIFLISLISRPDLGQYRQWTGSSF